jgi:DNA-binding IclR family transcriptional regulator
MVQPRESKPKYGTLVPAVEQAARILVWLAEHPDAQATLTEISRQIGIHKSKAYAILNTMMQFSLVRRETVRKTYSLGPGVLFLAGRLLDGLDLREIARPFLKDLAESTSSTAFLGLVSGDHVYVAALDQGKQAVAVTFRLGHRFPLTWGAHGKALVAFLPDQDRNRILEQERSYFHGDSSPLDTERLRQELLDCRKTGYALDPGDMKPGVRAIAAPVWGPGASLLGAMVLLGTFSLDEARHWGPMVADRARGLSGALGAGRHSIPMS